MPRKSPNTWMLSNTLLNKLWVKEEITVEIRKYFKLNTVKTQPIEMCGMKLSMVGGNVIAPNAYIRKEERSQLMTSVFILRS